MNELVGEVVTAPDLNYKCYKSIVVLISNLEHVNLLIDFQYNVVERPQK